LSLPTLLSSNAWHCKPLETQLAANRTGGNGTNQAMLTNGKHLLGSVSKDHFCLDQSTQEQLRVSGTVTLESGISKFNKHLLRMQKQTIISQITCANEDK
jgi:hypothetical protein